MPVHDWSKIEAGIFHDFHHAWIEEIKRALNAGILPPDYYALAEQFAAGFGPDVLALQFGELDSARSLGSSSPTDCGIMLAPPKLSPTAETEMEFYRRKQTQVAVRHVTDDRVVAILEIVSPGNKNSRYAIRQFLEKAAKLMDMGIHLLIVDVHLPGPRDPQGIHSEIWQYITDQPETPPPSKPLTVVSYEADAGIRCFVQHFQLGDPLPDSPLFLRRDRQVPVPLERTYATAVDVMPRRWREVLQNPR